MCRMGFHVQLTAKNVPVLPINYTYLKMFFLNIFFEYISQDYSYKFCMHLLKYSS